MPSNWLYIDTNFPTFTGGEKLDEKVTTIQNYLFMLVEQMRYTLHNLDTSNMNGTALERYSASLTDPIYARIEDDEGNLTQLAVTAQGLAGRISDAEGNITQLGVTAAGLASRVSDNEGNISALSQTATKLQSQITSANGNISTLQQTATGLTSRVSSAEGSISTLQQYVNSITLSVTNGSTSSVIALTAGNTTIASQTITMSGLVTYTGLANGTTTINGGCIQTGLIEAEYLDLTGAITWSDLSRTVQNDINDAYTMAEDAQTVANDVDGIISDWSYTYRGTTYIDGAQLMTGTVTASTLQGGEVLLLDASEAVAGSITLAGASSYSGRKVVIESGAIEFSAIYGDLFAENGDGTYWQLSGSELIVGYGDLRSNQSAAWDLGTAARPWNNVYAESCEACTSDRNKKHDIESLPGKYLNMLLELPVYRFKLDSGTSDRYHPGYTAQDVAAYMAKHGIDSLEFAGFVKDKDDDGNDIYMLRYGEFIPLHTAVAQKHEQEIAGMKAEIQNLKIKMEAAGL